MHRAKGDRLVRASGLPVRQCIFSYMVLNARKLVFGAEGAKSKGADPLGPICAFVIRLLESIMYLNLLQAKF